MQLADLAAFLAVAAERSFSDAARKLHRTQPAVSQAVRRLEDELGERLFDRYVAQRHADRSRPAAPGVRPAAARLAGEAQTAVRELQQVRRGRVIIGANEAAVHSLLPHIERFAAQHPQVAVEVRRVPSRQIAGGGAGAQLDFGVLTFQPADRGRAAISLGGDELVMLRAPSIALAAGSA